MFETYLERWNLTPDGAPVRSLGGDLLFVRQGGAPAVLKIPHEAEERRGSALMAYYAGDGAARVLAYDGTALLLERLTGSRSLVDMARSRGDDDASHILCGVVARLHAPRAEPPPELAPLPLWFAALERAAGRGGTFAKAWAVARGLLAAPQDATVLHGDIHHGNVLHDEARGWLAIDPKGLIGERGYDYANIFNNPDAETARAPGRLARQASVVAQAAGLDRTRLLQWIVAYIGLSSAWTAEDGDEPIQLAVAEIALAELGW